MTTTALRSRFWLKCLEQYAAQVPYVWGGRHEGGMDCSGFVTMALFKASEGRIDWKATHNTDALWQLPKVETENLIVGDLVLYWGPTPRDALDVSHVMVYAGAGLCMGQAYGGPQSINPAQSRSLGHVTKVLPLHYRHDLAGFVRLPLI